MSSLRRIMLGLSLGLLVSNSYALVAMCALAGDSVEPPSGGYLRTLYDVDFEAPAHSVGGFPTEGIGRETIGFYGTRDSTIPETHKGNPEVVASQTLLDGQSAELNARPVHTDQFDYDQMDFQLGRQADYYTFDADLVIDDLQSLNRLIIQTHDNSSASQCSLVFTPSGYLYMTQNLTTYSMDTRYHVRIIATPNGDNTGRLHITFSSAAGTLYEGEFILSMSGDQDMGLFRFQMQDSNGPDTNYAQVDNVVIKAGYLSLPEIPAPNAGDHYLLDLGGDFVLFGKYHLQQGFGILFPSSNSDIGNDSAVLHFAAESYPVITHRLGLPFDLLELELGEYSSSSPAPTAVTFTGYHFDGSTSTLEFTTDGVADGAGGELDMEIVTFDESWEDLEYVTFTGYSSIDKVRVRTSVDRDGDDIHDWVDACLPATASEQAIEMTVEKLGICPLQQGNAGSIGSSAALLLLIALRRRRGSHLMTRAARQ